MGGERNDLRSETFMWIIVRTVAGKNNYLTTSSEWTLDPREAETFDHYGSALHRRDTDIPVLQRRGIGVIRI